MTKKTNDPTEVDPRINELRGEAAALIRQHLWRSKSPPQVPADMNHDPRPWHMGRDLSIWNALVREGNDPETVNGAITKVRKLLSRIPGPMTMHIFYSNGGKTRPIFEQSKSAWLRDQEKQPKLFKDALRSVLDG